MMGLNSPSECGMWRKLSVSSLTKRLGWNQRLFTLRSQKKPDLVKRLVLLHPSGLRRIIGTVEGSVTPSELRSLPEVESGECELAKVEARYVMYREIKPRFVEDGA